MQSTSKRLLFCASSFSCLQKSTLIRPRVGEGRGFHLCGGTEESPRRQNIEDESSNYFSFLKLLQELMTLLHQNTKILTTPIGGGGGGAMQFFNFPEVTGYF